MLQNKNMKKIEKTIDNLIIKELNTYQIIKNLYIFNVIFVKHL